MGFTSTVPPQSQVARNPVIQSLIDFLQSPFWINPIQSFIDENSLVFGGEEENCLEHTFIHEKFRELIENLLEFLVGELNLSHEEFIKALQSETYDETLGQALEHIMAMDDFLSFKKIMERRNLQLEFETIEEMKKTQKQMDPEVANVDVELQKVLLLSKQEHEESLRTQKTVTEREEYELAIGASLSEQERYLQDSQKRLEQAELEMAIAISLSLQEEQKRREMEEEAERLRLQQIEERRKQEEEELRLQEERRLKLLQSMEEEEKRKIQDQLERERKKREMEEKERIKREEERERLEQIKRDEEMRRDEQRQLALRIEEEKQRKEQEGKQLELNNEEEESNKAPKTKLEAFNFNFKTSRKSEKEIEEELNRIQKERELLQKLMTEKEKQEEITSTTMENITQESIAFKKEVKEGKERLVEKKKQEREERLKEFKLKLSLKKGNPTENGSSSNTPKNAKPIVSPITAPTTVPFEKITSPKNDTPDDSDARKRMIREALSKRVKDDLLRQSQPIIDQPKIAQTVQAIPVQNTDHLRSLLNNVVRNLKKNVDEEDFHFSETK